MEHNTKNYVNSVDMLSMLKQRPRNSEYSRGQKILSSVGEKVSLTFPDFEE